MLPYQIVPAKTAERRILSIFPYLLFFYFASFIGWIWEVLVYWVLHHDLFHLPELFLVYRGVLHGPWTPIYGVGAVLMVLLHKKAGRYPILFFLTCMGICGVGEYLTSWGLEVLFHAKWWDYTGYFLNLNGRICAMSLVFFALAGMAVAYGVVPLFWKKINRLSKSSKQDLCFILTVIFLLDVMISFVFPNTGLGIKILP